MRFDRSCSRSLSVRGKPQFHRASAAGSPHQCRSSPGRRRDRHQRHAFNCGGASDRVSRKERRFQSTRGPIDDSDDEARPSCAINRRSENLVSRRVLGVQQQHAISAKRIAFSASPTDSSRASFDASCAEPRRVEQSRGSRPRKARSDGVARDAGFGARSCVPRRKGIDEVDLPTLGRPIAITGCSSAWPVLPPPRLRRPFPARLLIARQVADADIVLGEIEIGSAETERDSSRPQVGRAASLC
jgi:hypothetical protein